MSAGVDGGFECRGSGMERVVVMSGQSDHRTGLLGKLAALGLLAAALACGLPTGCSKGRWNNLFAAKFVSTPVPRDFAIVIDRNTSTYFARVHVHQLIQAADRTSRTTYTTWSDYHHGIASRYSTTTKLTQAQLQAMWNEVCRHRLMRNAFTWVYWYSPIDRYQRNSMTLQIRANGQERVYHQINHWDNNKLPLIQLCESVNLPIGRQVHPQAPPPPTTQSVATQPAAPPATAPVGR